MADPTYHERLSDAQVRDNLATLPSWSLDAGGRALSRTYQFADFISAVRFMMRAAPRCDLMGHYPEWISMHTRLDVRLTTHDCAGVSHRDLALAAHLDQVFGGGTK